MHSNHTIYLVGPMGSGKTAVGQRLAKLLEREFIDTDREIEERCGVDVSFVFEKEGESGFRQREHKILQSLSEQHNLVIATGGGIITQLENRQILLQTGIVIYLETSVDQQHARTQHNNTRPLLNGVDAMEKLHELYTLRAPLYQEVADITVSTNGQRVQNVARTIHLQLKNFEKKK